MKARIIFLLADVLYKNICKDFLKETQGKFNIFFVLDRTKACRTGHIILVIDQ